MKYQVKVDSKVVYVTDTRISQDQLRPYFIDHEFKGSDLSNDVYTWIFVTRKKPRGVSNG